MNPNALRGLAALVLLCFVLPRASALNFVPVADDRVATLTGTFNANPISLQQTPAAPFATFQSAIGGPGITLGQNSGISGNVLYSQGSFLALWQGNPGDVVALNGSSLFSMTFQITDPTPFFLDSFREIGGGGRIDVSLTGPGVSILWAGPTGTFVEPNNRQAFGTLGAGLYTLKVDERIDLYATGNGLVGWSGRYRVSLALGVPEPGHTAVLFGACLVLCLLAHRNKARSLPGV